MSRALNCTTSHSLCEDFHIIEIFNIIAKPFKIHSPRCPPSEQPRVKKAACKANFGSMTLLTARKKVIYAVSLFLRNMLSSLNVKVTD